MQRRQHNQIFSAADRGLSPDFYRERDEQIRAAYFVEQRTMEDIAGDWGVSRQRVSQIIMRLLECGAS